MFSPQECAEVLGGLEQIEQRFGGQACPEHEAEDLHTWLEAILTELVGDSGKKIHTARSRNDQVATLLKMYIVSAGETFSADLCRLIEIISHKAKVWSEQAFALHTHQQFAAPGNVGFWALRFAVAFDRVRNHTDFLVSEWRRFCPLGSGAVAGSSIPIDRHLQARGLGFDRASLNALDSTSSRDECVELLALYAQAALHLQSFAADVILFSQTPLDWAEYPSAFGTGSSMMPNKTNPDAMELLRGTCSEITSAHGHAIMLLKGLPSGYNRDLQCIKPLVRNTVEKMHDMCELAATFIECLDFDSEKLKASLQQGEIGATLRMEREVRNGMPLREAHHKIAVELSEDGEPAVPQSLPNIEDYKTTGSANPAETRRIADLLLEAIQAKGE